jgi:hypothetical protein
MRGTVPLINNKSHPLPTPRTNIAGGLPRLVNLMSPECTPGSPWQLHNRNMPTRNMGNMGTKHADRNL